MPKKIERAGYGAAAYEGLKGKVPTAFPRIIGPNALKYVREVIESGLTCDMTGRFEKAFAEALGAKHCIAAPGCSPALALLARSLPFEPGDEIIFSPVTDYGTIMGFIHANYIPVFADTEPGTVNVNAETIEKCIGDRTRAIVVVHKTGIICDMDPINELAKKRGLVVIEDACQAVFGRYKGRLAGTLSDFATFSFDAEKTMGSDIGGCIVTNDDDMAEYIRFYGQSRGARMRARFGRVHAVAGNALRMPHCTAAICLAQLEIIRDQVAQRDRMARLITEKLAEIPGITPTPIPDYLDVYSAWMIGFSIDPGAFRCDADEFAVQCAEAGIPGIGTARYYLMPEACPFLDENARKKVYPYSIPPASRRYRYGGKTCPNAKAYLDNWLRWSTFCARYRSEHCEIVARIVSEVAERNRI